MSLNAIGDIIDTTWHWLGDHHEHIVLDEQVIMPNHLHGIIFLTDQQAARSPIPHKPLGRLIGAFKAVSTRRVKELPHPPERLWHRNYWDRVIRNQQELDTVREYIRNNPLKWELDRLNPEHRTSVRSPPERRMR
jgi:REP element-mobilizing transposase RayT